MSQHCSTGLVPRASERGAGIALEQLVPGAASDLLRFLNEARLIERETWRSRMRNLPSTIIASISPGWPLCSQAETMRSVGTRCERCVSTTIRSAFLPTSSEPIAACWRNACAPPRVVSRRMSSGWGCVASSRRILSVTDQYA